MASKGKINFEFITGDILASDTTSTHSLYGIQLESQSFKDTLPERRFRYDRIGTEWWNITADKNGGLYGLIGVFYTTPSVTESRGDQYCHYDKCLYLPSYTSFGSVSSLEGAKKPYGAKYPALIDFNAVSFISTLLGYKNIARKQNTVLGQTYKQHIIKSASTILAKFITRQDTMYLNPFDLEFYDVKTHQKVNPNVPDERIFRPFTKNKQISKQELLREWYKFRYFGSNLMIPTFTENSEKKDKYLKSLVKENEELISIEEINYDKLSDDVLTKLVLNECLTDFYDFNDNLELNIHGKKYTLDVRNNEFLDSDGNVVPYIPIYNTTTKELEYALSFKEYTNLLKETYTDADKKIQQEVVAALKNDTVLPSTQNVTPVKPSILKWTDKFYYDTSKSGRYVLWWGKYNIRYNRYWGTSNYWSWSGGDSYEDGYTYQGYNETKTYSFTFDEITAAYNKIVARKMYINSTDEALDESEKTPGKRKTYILPLTLQEALDKWLYENITGEYDEDQSKITLSGTISYYEYVETGYYEKREYEDDAWVKTGWYYALKNTSGTDGSASIPSPLPDKITSLVLTEQRQAYNAQYVYEYKEGLYLTQQDATYTLIKRYDHNELMLELFGPITNLNNINKTNAKYDLIDTYFHETDYVEGDVWNTVTIQPVFVIPNVTCKNEIQAETQTLVYHKKIYTKEEASALPQEDQDNLLTDDKGQLYKIEYRGKKLESTTYTKSSTKTQAEVDKMTASEKNNLVKNSDGSYYKDSSGNYLYNEVVKSNEYVYDIYDDDGNKIGSYTEVKDYDDSPYISYEPIIYEELVKFSLPKRQLKIYSKLSNYIQKLRSGVETGYVIVYKDKTDGKTKTRKISISSNDYQLGTCDMKYEVIKCLPLVPFFNYTCVIDPIKQGKILPISPDVFAAAAIYAAMIASAAYIAYAAAYAIAFAAFMVPYLILVPILNAKWKMGFLGFNKVYKPQIYYYYYDKKVNLYYKNAFNYYLKEWEKVLNDNYTDDTFTDNSGKTVKVKMNKKVSKRFTNEDAISYMPSILEKPDETIEDYDEYTSKCTMFGAHTSVRFSFTIFFNSHFRQTKLIARMGFIYLDYFCKKMGNVTGVWLEQKLYPPDRVHYPEKQKTLRFKKDKIDTSIEGGNASFYCEFYPADGQFVFYKKSKKEKITLDINTYIPRWRTVYFSGKDTYKQKAYSQQTTSEKIDGLAISKSDLQPMQYTDSFTPVLASDVPVTKYTKSGSSYTLTVNALYYGVPIVVKYQTADGKQKQRTINPFSKSNTNDYTTYYAPYDLTDYTFDENLYSKTLNNFEQTDVKTYIINLIKNKTEIEVQDIYKTVIGKDIDVLSNIENMFNYDGVFDILDISVANINNFKKQDTDETVKSYTFDRFPHYSANEVARHQSYWLNVNYNPNCVISQSDVNSDTIKSKNVAAREIATYLLENDYLPLNRFLTPNEWVSAFKNYDKDGLLAQIFSEREIYDIGFYNYLVTNDTAQTELTLLLEEICKIDRTFVTSMADLKNGSIQYNSVWLPLPADVYKKFPIYSKNLVASIFLLVEQYQVVSVPSVYPDNIRMMKVYTATTIITAITGAVISIVSAVFTGGATLLAWVQMVLTIAAAVCQIISFLLQLIALVLPTTTSRKLRQIGSYFSYAGQVLGIINSIVSMAGNGLVINEMTIATLVMQSISYALKIAERIVIKNIAQKQLEDNARLNIAIEDYNESIDELYSFIEQNEFEGALLDQYQPINIDVLESNIFDTTYDASIESYTTGALEAIYVNVDDYYANRLG